MRCEVTHDADEFWHAAHEWLELEPVRNSVLLTNLLGRRAGKVVDERPPTWVSVYDDAGERVGAAMRTPPFNICLSPQPLAAIEPLVDVFEQHDPDALGVTAETELAEAFAHAWSARIGKPGRAKMRQRVHQLDRVVWPERPAAGTARLARQEERDLLVAWSEAFVTEVEHGGHPSGKEGRGVDLRLAEDRAYVWDDDGVVCYVGVTYNIAGVVRIGPVYTPPEKRGKGYASSLVAACSQGALDAGAKLCALFTDLANPTSNKIYAAVGYRPVTDFAVYRFESSN